MFYGWVELIKYFNLAKRHISAIGENILFMIASTNFLTKTAEIIKMLILACVQKHSYSFRPAKQNV